MNPRQRAGALIMAMPPACLAKMMPYLSSEDVVALSQHMTRLQNVDGATLKTVFSDFLNDFGNTGVMGGYERVERLLEKAMPPGDAQTVLRSIQKASSNVWAHLEDMPDDLLYAKISEETPQTVAVVLSKLSDAKVGAFLEKWPEERLPDLLERLLQPIALAPSAWDTLEKALWTLLGKAPKPDLSKRMADVLGWASPNLETRLWSVFDQDPTLQQNVRKHLTTFEDIAQWPAALLQAFLREIDKMALACALKDRPEVQKAFFDAVPARSAALLREEMEFVTLDSDASAQARRSLVAQAKTFRDARAKQKL